MDDTKVFFLHAFAWGVVAAIGGIVANHVYRTRVRPLIASLADTRDVGAMGGNAPGVLT